MCYAANLTQTTKREARLLLTKTLSLEPSDPSHCVMVACCSNLHMHSQ